VSDRAGIGYLRWVEQVLNEIARPRQNRALVYGIHHVGAALGLGERATQQAVWEAVQDLELIDLVRSDSGGFDLRLTQEGLKVREGVRLETAWPRIAKQHLTAEQEQFLVKLIELSERPSERYAVLEYVQARDVFEALGWPTDDIGPFYELPGQLKEVGCADVMAATTGGNVPVRPTYYGIVRATQQVLSAWQATLPDLIDVWETTSVEFKRELSLRKVDDKAEFVRDILALATTQASGDRLMIVGFDPKTRAFAETFNPKVNSDHLEDVLNEYVKPPLQVRLDRVAWASGEVGIIEAVREPAKVPYQVRRDVGPLHAGQIFVRHGTHVSEPDPEELVSLREEGERARSQT
jgi:hypothetical protein